MDKKVIQSIWSAWQEVQEKKKAPVTKKDDDGEGMDPVGKEDGDIDNDGDKDCSDEYLAKRRKAIGKNMKKDDVKEAEESPYPSLDKKKREKKGSNLEPAGGPADKVKGALGENSDEEGEKEECPKCKGKGCDHCDGKGYHMKEGGDPVHMKLYGKKKKMKESNLFSDAELEALEEKMKQPNDTGTPSEPFMSTSSPKEKKVFADHEKGSEKKYEDWEETSEMDGSKAGRAVKSQASSRRGDNLKVGDNAMPTPKKVKGQ